MSVSIAPMSIWPTVYHRLLGKSMSNPRIDESVETEAAGAIRKVRWMMAVSGATTLVAIAAVLGIVGYRLFSAADSATAPLVTATLPKNGRVIATAVSDSRLLVTLDIGGAVEVHSFDARTLRPTGRLRFVSEP
jgi:hypothetical protein